MNLDITESFRIKLIKTKHEINSKDTYTMKKALLSFICLAMIVVSTDLKAQGITISLRSGWNWISYPNAVAMEFSEALGTFTPMEGDMIKSEFGFAEYSNGHWSGSITHFMPGEGYMYRSMQSESVDFVFADASNLVVVTTTLTNVTPTSAVVSGTVTLPESCHVFLRGICWGTEQNPDIDGNHTSEGSGTGMFTSILAGLNLGITYYARAYIVSDYGLAYGNELSFTTDTHEFVDLGLPSGLLWATCNVGAYSLWDYGDYFAWGETQSKWEYDLSTYQHCYGEWNTLTKYCNSFSFGVSIDNLTTLLPEDDAATANWGGDWRTPSKEEWEELCQNTTHSWTTQNGFYGWLFTASNGNSLFLPASGYYDEYWSGFDFFGYYWSSSLYTTNSNHAWLFYFNSSSNSYMNHEYRFYGYSVRPVRSLPQSDALTLTTSQVADITKTTAVGGGIVIEDGSTTVTEYGICWSTSHNPTLSCSHASSGMGIDSFTCTMTGLKTNTTYYVRAYARDNVGITYGNEVSFITDNYDYVDLGLPSGNLWATCNVGADAPEDYGDYFAWGEVEPKDEYNFSNYQYCVESGYNELFTKYCNNPDYGYNGYVDYMNILEPCDDAATVNWGEDWHMPKYTDWLELYYNTTNTWTTLNGVNGRLFTASNGNSLFLPAAGHGIFDIIPMEEGEEGRYWSSILDEYNTDSGRSVSFSSSGFYFGCANRCCGFPVRPVLSVE
jgi:hypothetical protein